jgi:uncharacterized protein (PEP-CTERM system associated)
MATEGRVPRPGLCAALLALVLTGNAEAQLAPDSAPSSGTTTYGTAPSGAPAASSTSTSANASASTQRKGGWQIVPSIELRGTITDNVDQAPSDKERSDFITEIIPGISIDGQGAHAKLHLDYRMDNLIYARDSSRNELQNYLNASGTLEAIENFFYVDARANIDQEAISAFGARPSNPTTVSNNRTETRTYQVSPYFQGRLAGTTDYLLRYDYNDQHTTSDVAGDSQVEQATARLNGPTRLNALTWMVEAVALRTDYSQGRDTEDNRARAVLTYAFDPQFRVNGTGGYERANYITLDMTGNSTYGGGFDWAPTPRTKLHADWERRFFGDSWDYRFSHYLSRVSMAISDTRNVTTDAQDRVGSPGYTAAYDLLFAALASSIPDPIDRGNQVQEILRGGSVPPGLALPSNFVIGSSYVERLQQASIAFLGVRNTVTLSVYRNSKDILGLGQDIDVTPGVNQNTLEWGAGAVYSHRLTGLTTFNAAGTWRRTESTSGPEMTSRQFDGRIGLASQFGPRTTGGLEYRYTRFDGDGTTTNDYRENSVFASLLFRF